MKDRRTSISLFSGAGGMDIGIRKSGFDILVEIESDEHCCSTLRAAVERERTSTAVIEADIRQIDPRKLKNKFKLKNGELDLLFGGPPCQSFSLAGKQLGLCDERGLLLFEIIRFANILQPKVILLEQVKGLLSSKGSSKRRGEVFENFLAELELYTQMASHFVSRLWRATVKRASFCNRNPRSERIYFSRKNTCSRRRMQWTI
jgi:DNA (cytosine-5)-methyltransferase 1